MRFRDKRSPLGEISSLVATFKSLVSYVSSSADQRAEDRAAIQLLKAWDKIKALDPTLFKEMNPDLQLASAIATFKRTGSLEAAVSQLAADLVLGAAEHIHGISVLSINYRITPKGFATEVTVRTPDGFSQIRTFYLVDLLFPPQEQIALAQGSNYRPMPKDQVEDQLNTQADFMMEYPANLKERQVNQVVILSFGHQVGSDQNWMYIYQRDPQDPNIVLVTAVRLPDDYKEAIAFRDRMLVASGLGEFIPNGSPTDRVVLRGDAPRITPQAVAIAAGGSSFLPINSGKSGEEFVGFGEKPSEPPPDFKWEQEDLERTIRALIRKILETIDAADLQSITAKFELSLELAGEYLLGQLLAKRGYGFKGGKSGAGAGVSEQISDSDYNVGFELDEATISSALADSLANEGIQNLVEEEESTLAREEEQRIAAEESEMLLQAEVESGDDGYEGVVLPIEAYEEDVASEHNEEESDSDEAQLGLVLNLTSEDDVDRFEQEDAANEQSQDEISRLKGLVEELGGDTSLLSFDQGEVSALGLLIGDGELPAFSELAEFSKLVLMTEVIDAVSSDLEDEIEENGSLDSDGLAFDSEADAPEITIGEIESAGAEEAAAFLPEAAVLQAVGEEDEPNKEESLLADGVGQDEQEKSESERSLGEADLKISDGELFAAEEELLADEDELVARGDSKKMRANRRRAAIRALNRLRYQAEMLNINVSEIMKIRQRRGLKRLWFEQLVFALARELKFDYEQRHALARELELSGADFDDVRQAELAIRRELHTRKLQQTSKLPKLEELIVNNIK